MCSVGQTAELATLPVGWGLHPENTVTDRFSLDRADEAYETFDGGKTGWVAII